MLNWEEESFGEKRNNAVNEPCKKAVIATPDILRRLSTKMRVQVSEQANYLTFPCGGVLYISQLGSYKQKTKIIAKVKRCAR